MLTRSKRKRNENETRHQGKKKKFSFSTKDVEESITPMPPENTTNPCQYKREDCKATSIEEVYTLEDDTLKDESCPSLTAPSLSRQPNQKKKKKKKKQVGEEKQIIPFESIDSMFKCGICFDLLNDPQTLANCGHTFCSACLNPPDLKIISKCPTCRIPISSPSVAVIALRNIGELCFPSSRHNFIIPPKKKDTSYLLSSHEVNESLNQVRDDLIQRAIKLLQENIQYANKHGEDFCDDICYRCCTLSKTRKKRYDNQLDKKICRERNHPWTTNSASERLEEFGGQKYDSLIADMPQEMKELAYAQLVFKHKYLLEELCVSYSAIVEIGKTRKTEQRYQCNRYKVTWKFAKFLSKS